MSRKDGVVDQEAKDPTFPNQHSVLILILDSCFLFFSRSWKTKSRVGFQSRIHVPISKARCASLKRPRHCFFRLERRLRDLTLTSYL